MNVLCAVHLIAPTIVAQKDGAIVNISTARLGEPAAMFPTSAAASAGLAAYVKLFANQYAPYNICMNNALPAWVDSLPQTDEHTARPRRFPRPPHPRLAWRRLHHRQ